MFLYLVLLVILYILLGLLFANKAAINLQEDVSVENLIQFFGWPRQLYLKLTQKD